MAADAFIRRCSIGWRSKSPNSFRNKTLRPRDIVILAPFLGDALRFALEDRLQPPRHSDAITAAFALVERRSGDARLDDAGGAGASAVADRAAAGRCGAGHHPLDRSPRSGARPFDRRAALSRCGRPVGRAELRPFENLKPDLQERIGFEVGAKYRSAADVAARLRAGRGAAAARCVLRALVRRSALTARLRLSSPDRSGPHHGADRRIGAQVPADGQSRSLCAPRSIRMWGATTCAW